MCSCETIYLKKIHKRLPDIRARHRRRKKLSLESGFLSRSPILELQKHGIQSTRIDAEGVPARIEITGLRFARHIAPIEINCLTSSNPEPARGIYKPVEEFPPPRIGCERCRNVS